MILSPEAPNSEDVNDQIFLELYQNAIDLYGLIHARFIQTSKGLQLINQKYVSQTYGTCPLVFCKKNFLLPIGLHEDLCESRVKCYCSKCEEVYFPRKKGMNLDGAYFGPSFPQLFLQAYPEYCH